MNKLLTLAINKLGHDWSHLNWEFRDFELEDGTPDKMSQWQGDPEEDIMIVEEAAKYFNIGINKLRFMTNDENCSYVVWNGSKRLIKRKPFEEYLYKQYSI